MGVQSLVGGNGPGSRGPNDRKSACAGGQGIQTKGGCQGCHVIRLKGHVQRVALLVLVFDFEFGQTRAAVEAPVHGLEATVHKAAFDDALERPNFSGFVGGVHGAVGAIPVTQYTQALEVFTLLVDLLGGKGATLGLHVIAAEFAAMQFLNGVLNR